MVDLGRALRMSPRHAARESAMMSSSSQRMLYAPRPMPGMVKRLAVVMAAVVAGVLIARADPAPPVTRELSALKVFNMTLVRTQDRYVDPSRMVPRRMLSEALDRVQLE